VERGSQKVEEPTFGLALLIELIYHQKTQMYLTKVDFKLATLTFKWLATITIK
jgi:ABC-type transporter Mla MlaB component